MQVEEDVMQMDFDTLELTILLLATHKLLKSPSDRGMPLTVDGYAALSSLYNRFRETLEEMLPEDKAVKGVTN